MKITSPSHRIVRSLPMEGVRKIDKKNRTCFRGLALGCILSLVSASAGAQPAPVESPQRVFYFGNSLTQSTRPELHEALGASAGKTWKNDSYVGAGWQPWQHRNGLWRAMGKPVDSATQSAQSRGDLTISEEAIRSAPFKPRKFFAAEWDAIVIQIFGPRLDWKTDTIWSQKFDGEVEIGEVAACRDIIRIFLEKNPDGRVFIYTVWPQMGPGKLPPESEWPEWAKAMKARSGRVRTAEFPDREAFDYATFWERTYVRKNPETGRPENARSRDFTNQVFDGLRQEFPELWKEGRLTRIPAGELYYELDKVMQAGDFPGHTTIEDFYTDVQHQRWGLPGYTLAALFYATIFQERPDALDHTIYTDPAHWKEDRNHDWGEIIPISPAQAKIVNDSIWSLLNTHPDAWGGRNQ